MNENDENDVIEGRLLTLNQICNIVGGHYQTTKKIVDSYVENGRVKTGKVKRRNRPFEAYYVSDTILAEIQIALQEIRRTSSPVEIIKTLTKNYNENVDISTKSNNFNQLQENEEVKMSGNVKFYEVIKQNNELENKIKILEAEIKDKELAHAHEREKINGEKIQLQADNYKLQADIKLIEDKSSSMESAWAQEKQRAEALEKVVKSRNIQLLITGAVLLVVIVVICCYFLFARL